MDFKFPHTPHLAWLGKGAPRADKVLTPDEARRLLSLPVAVEEKLDGANIGIRFDSLGRPVVKNRGTVLGPGSHPQFQMLWPWLAERQGDLYAALGRDLILFGEWCFAVHSVCYQDLPDYFAPFDLYDLTARKFFSVKRRDALTSELGLVNVPLVGNGRYTLAELERLLMALPSRYGGEPAEGLYVRQDGPEWLRERAKLVRPEFVQAMEEHWSAKPLERNGLKRVHR